MYTMYFDCLFISVWLLDILILLCLPHITLTYHYYYVTLHV